MTVKDDPHEKLSRLGVSTSHVATRTAGGPTGRSTITPSSDTSRKELHVIRGLCPTQPEPQVLGHSPDLTRMRWHNVLIGLWRGEVTASARAGLDEDLKALTQSISADREGLYVISIIEPEASPPDEQARREIAKSHERFHPWIRGHVVLVAGRGFFVSSVMAIATNFTADRRWFAQRAFRYNSRTAAVHWLTRQRKADDRVLWTPDELDKTVDWIRDRVHSPDALLKVS